MKTLLFAAVLIGLNLSAHAQRNAAAPTPLLTKPADANIAVLNSNAGLKEKVDACRELAVVGSSKAVPVLVSLLADEHLGHMARHALETIPGPAVDEALRAELTRLKGRPLVGVIGSVGVRRDTKAVKPLTALLTDADAQVAQAAARALGTIGGADATKALENALSKATALNRLALYEGLFRCAESQAASGESKEAIALYDRLSKASDAPHQVRAGALRGAIVTRGKGGASLLKESLASNDRVLFAAAVRSSIEMPGSDVTRVLASVLPQLQPDNQLVVVQALALRSDDVAVPALATLAKNGTTSVRTPAIRAAAAIGSSSAVAMIVDLIVNSEPGLSQAAADALAGMPGRNTDAAVLDLLKSPNPKTRLAAMDIAGRRQINAAVPALLAAAADSDSKVRSSALQGVGRLGTPAEVPGLLKLLLATTEEQQLNDLSRAISSICTRAGSPPATMDQVTAALSGAAPTQKAALLGILGSSGGEKSLTAIRASLNDSDPAIKEAAVNALSEWPDASAAPDLLQFARSENNSKQRTLALRSYVRLVRESAASQPEKLKLLNDAAPLATNPQDKTLILAALGDINSVESLRSVVPYLADASVADQAAAVVVKISEKLGAKRSADIAPALNQVLKSAKSPQVLDRARKLMAELKLPAQ